MWSPNSTHQEHHQSGAPDDWSEHYNHQNQAGGALHGTREKLHHKLHWCWVEEPHLSQGTSTIPKMQNYLGSSI